VASTIDSNTADSAYLRAKARVETWAEKFNAQWNAPQMATLYGATAKNLSQMPPDAQTASRKMHPDGWEQVDKIVRKQEGAL